MTNAIPKILLVGQLRAGKSEVADHLRYEHSFTEIAFGGMLKYYAKHIFTHANGKDEATPRKPRALYQQFGELCRQIDPLVWVKHADFAYQQAVSDSRTKGIVVSDGRQPHEISWARDNGFVVIRVTAPDELRKARAIDAGDEFSEADFAHDTEQHVAGFAVDYEITNDGDLTGLWARVDEVISAKGKR